MSRVVADTNIMISALIFGGLPGTFLDLARMRVFTLVSSPDLFDELDEKLRGKFQVPPSKAAAIRSNLEAFASVTRPGFTLNVVADDPDDNRVVECAIAGKADCIVSGDRHLLKMGSYEGISIMTVRSFLESSGIQF
jgi:putative PIN family toxin of toxin-antitoxin system